MKQSFLGCAKALALLLAVYLPTFGIVSALIVRRAGSNPPEAAAMTTAFPLVIGISLAIALILIAILGGRQFRSYGFRSVPGKTVLLSLALGPGVSMVLRLLAWGLGVHGPSLFAGLRTWQVIAFLWVGAPLQEEIIFRGLFQTTLERGIPKVMSVGRWQLSVAAIGSAVVFALAHLGLLSVGASWGTIAFAGGGALLLGLLAGHLRWRTGSLIPGILIHAFFNVTGSVWS